MSAVPRHIAEQHAADDPILQTMLRRGVPLTREAYVAMNWPDEPEEWTPEHEEQMPACFRDPKAIKELAPPHKD